MPYLPYTYFPVGATSSGGGGSASGSLLLTPHTLTVYEYADDDNGVAQDGDSLGTIACHISPETFATAYEEFAVECKNPYYVICNISEEIYGMLLLGQKGTANLGVGVQTFRVVFVPKIHGADETDTVNYLSFLIERQDRV